MALVYRGIVDEASGRILAGRWADEAAPLRYGERDGLSAGQVLRTYPREPQRHLERDAAGTLRPATAEEIAGDKAAALAADVERELAALPPTLSTLLRRMLAELAAARGRDVTTYVAQVLADAKADAVTERHAKGGR